MSDDSQVILVGLGAGLGGFAGLLIIGCICWNILCGSWCEKKKVQKPVVPISSKHSRHTTTTTKVPNNIPTITPMKTSYIHLDLKSTASNDLASKLKSVRQ